MDVAADAIAFTTDHQCHLGVRLETNHPIDDVDANLLKRLGPRDVGLFVAPRLQFHQGNHLLS